MNENWKVVIKRILKSLALVSVALTVAYISAPTVSAYLALSLSQAKVFKLVSLGIVAWGTLGKSGFEIQTYTSQTAFEKFNSRWYLALYLVGLFCGGVGLLIEPVLGK